MDYVIDGKGITFKIDEHEMFKAWTEFTIFADTEEYFFLFIKRQGGLVFRIDQMPEGCPNFVRERAAEYIR